MPESCWESCITTPITRGALKVGLHMSSVIDILDSACWARSSALISSMSSSTWLLALNLLKALRASSSHCFVMSKYLEQRIKREKKLWSSVGLERNSRGEDNDRHVVRAKLNNKISEHIAKVYQSLVRALEIIVGKDFSLYLHTGCDLYLGDSGQTGSSSNCRMAGQIASPKRTGQPSFVPRICSMPSTWETRRPTVTASWFTVPRPPLRFNGAISDMYMGTSEVFKPQLTPMMNRPKNNISYEWAIFVQPIRHAPTMPSTLFSSKPPFLSMNGKREREKKYMSDTRRQSFGSSDYLIAHTYNTYIHASAQCGFLISIDTSGTRRKP